MLAYTSDKELIITLILILQTRWTYNRHLCRLLARVVAFYYKQINLDCLLTDQSGKLTLPLDGQREQDSEGTSDMDSPLRVCTSDTEWETNRCVCGH